MCAIIDMRKLINRKKNQTYKIAWFTINERAKSTNRKRSDFYSDGTDYICLRYSDGNIL